MARAKGSRQHSRVREAAATRYTTEPGPGALTGVLLDSDVVIEVLRGRKAVLVALQALERSGMRTYCTPITVAEIHAGLRSGETPFTEDFFRARGEVVLDTAIAKRAGSYLAAFARSHGVELADAFIAAAASTSGLQLWTLNRKHYPMRDVDFWAPPS